MKAWTQLIEPGPALATLCIAAILVSPCFAAPAQPEQHAEQSTEIEYYPVADATGCYYNFQHYDEGDRIITNEPCLNCTCHNRMLMCYLKVCPFTKAIGANCKVEKRSDQCCPVITCPEVPVQLVTSTAPSTALGHLNEYGCSIDNLFYSDGARVPSNPDNPCELCYCIRNKTACVMQECTLNVEGCRPVFQEGVCCPVRYNCEHPDYLEGPSTPQITTTSSTTTTTTTETPTTTLQSAVQCVFHGDLYNDGELVKKDIPCEKCYCLRGDIVCAVQECGPTPLDKVNCTALPVRDGQCCPDTYDCAGVIEEQLTTLSSLSFETEPTTVSAKEPEPTITEQPLTTAHVELEERLPEISPEATELPAQAPETATKAAKGEETTKEVPEDGDKLEKQPTTPEVVEEATKQPVEAPQPASHAAETTKPVGSETSVTEQPEGESKAETTEKEAVTLITAIGPEVSVTQRIEAPVTEEEISPTTEGPVEAITTKVYQAIEAITSSVTEAVETITTAISGSTNEPPAKQPVEETSVPTEEPVTKITAQEVEEELPMSTEKAGITPLASEKEKPVEATVSSEKETPSVQPSEIPPEKEAATESTQLPEKESPTESTELPEKVRLPSELPEKEAPTGTEPTQLPEKEGPSEPSQLPEKESPAGTEPSVLQETSATEQTPSTSEQPTEEEEHPEVSHDEGEEIETELPETKKPAISESTVSPTEKTGAPEKTTVTVSASSEPAAVEFTTPDTRTEAAGQEVTEAAIVPEECGEQGCARIPATGSETPAEVETSKSAATPSEAITEAGLTSEVPVEGEKITDAKPQPPSEQPEEHKTTLPIEEIPDKSTATSPQPSAVEQPTTTEEEVVIVTEIPTKKTELPESMDHVSETAYSTEAPKEIPIHATEAEVAVTEEVETQRPISVSDATQQTTEKTSEVGITKLPSEITKPGEEQKTSQIGAGSTTELPREEENEIDLDDGHSPGPKTEERVTEVGSGEQVTEGEISEAEATTSPKEQPITVPSKIGETPEEVTEKAVVPEVCTSELECAPIIPSILQTEQPSKPTSSPEEGIPQEETTESNKIPEEQTEETNEIPESGTEPVAKVTEIVPETEGSGEKPTQTPTEEEGSGEVPQEESGITPGISVHPQEVTEIPELLKTPELSTEIFTGTEKVPPTETSGVPEGFPTKTQLPETTEYPEPTTLPEREIPGEGSCLVDGQTYKNNSAVPPINHCQASCRCVSSILRCESIECSPPPVEFENCIPIFRDANSCCPTYSCTGTETTMPIEAEGHTLQTTTPSAENVTKVDITTLSPTEEKQPEITSEGVIRSEEATVEKDTEVPVEEVTSPGLKDTEVTKEGVTRPAEILEEGMTEPSKKAPQTSEESVTELATGAPKEGVSEPTATSEEGATKPSKETPEVPEEGVTEPTPETSKKETTEPALDTTKIPEDGVTEPFKKTPEAPEEDITELATEASKEETTEPELETTESPEEGVTEPSRKAPEAPEGGILEGITETPKEGLAEPALNATDIPEDRVTEPSKKPAETSEEGVTEPATEAPKEVVTESAPTTARTPEERATEPASKSTKTPEQITIEPVTETAKEKVTESGPTTAQTLEEGITEHAFKTTEAPEEGVTEPVKQAPEVPEGTTKYASEVPEGVTEPATEIPEETVTEPAKGVPEVPKLETTEETPKETRPEVTEAPEGIKATTSAKKDEQGETQATEVPGVEISEEPQLTVHPSEGSTETAEIPEAGSSAIPEIFTDVKEEATTPFSEEAVPIDEGHKQITSSIPEVDKEKEAATTISKIPSEEVTESAEKENIPEAIPAVTTETKSEGEEATTPVIEVETETPEIVSVTTEPKTSEGAKDQLTTPQQPEKEGVPQIPSESDKEKPEEELEVFKEGTEAPEAAPPKETSKEEDTPQITEEPVEHVTMPEETFTRKPIEADSHVTEQQQTETPTERPQGPEGSQTLIPEEPKITQPSATELPAVTEQIKPVKEDQVPISEAETPALHPTKDEGLGAATSSPVTSEVEITDRAPLNETAAITSPAPDEEGQTLKTPEEGATIKSIEATEVPETATSKAQSEPTTVGVISSETESVPKEGETEAPGMTSVVPEKPQIKPISETSPAVPEAPATEEYQTEKGVTEAEKTLAPGLPSATPQPEVPERETTIAVSDAEMVTTPVPAKEDIASPEFEKEGSTETAYEHTTTLPEKELEASSAAAETPSETEEPLLETDKLTPTEPSAISEIEMAKGPTEKLSVAVTQQPIEGVPSKTEGPSEEPTELPEPSRTSLPGIPGEDHTEATDQPKEETPIFTSAAEVTSEATTGAENVSVPIRTGELFTSGPEVETTSTKHIPGELSTSIPISESTAALPATTSTELPSAHIPGEQAPEPTDYEQPGEDYDVEEPNAFGPGTCRYGGKVYVSAQQIPRDDPCDFCFCFRSDIICLQQSCPPPIPRCHEEPIRGFCCPRYECPVSMSTAVNVTTSTTTTTTTLPPHFFSHAYKGRASKTGCQISGKAYQVGEVIDSTSGPCLHCICGGDGQMKCDPKPCSPEPMIQQMIAAAALRRRR